MANGILPGTLVLIEMAANEIEIAVYGTFVLFSALSVRGIGTAHFGFEGRNKEHQGTRLIYIITTSMLTGPQVKQGNRAYI